jgi:nucleotide-binding universal stress UspA family protein
MVDLHAQRPFVLALGLDLADTETSGFAFEQAGRIASRIPQCQMHVVYVLPDDAGQEFVREAEALLKLYVSEKWSLLARPSEPSLKLYVRSGDAANEVVQVATDVDADLIVLGSRKVPHLKALFVGSTAVRVMAAAGCPVFIAGPKPKSW